jgi:RNA polymerase sigma-70 factor (ECF subfamily)
VTDAVDPRAAAEAAIRAKLVAADLRGAATDAIRLYGAEIYGFLKATSRDDDLAAEAFAQLGEDLWRGLPSFRWEASLRSWAYTLARNALHRLRRDPRRRPGNRVPLSDADVSGLVAELRTATAVYQRTEVKHELEALRALLDPDDHELLLLRLDRQLSWKDIARIRGGDEDLTTRAAALRKRFERAKELLRTLAAQRGLLG